MTNYSIKLLSVLILLIVSNTYALEKNRIIFKIGEEAFSLIDLENRNNYLKLLNEQDKILSRDELLKDLVSVNLFSISNKKNYTDLDVYKIELYNQFFKKYEKYDKKNKFNIIFNSIGKEKIFKNLEKDIVRKKILQNLLNQKKNLIISEGEKLTVDIFDINIHYFSFDNMNYEKIKTKSLIEHIVNVDKFKKELIKNNIIYLEDNKKITNLNKINKKIRKSILDGDKYFIVENNDSKLVGLIIKEINIQNKNIKFNFYHVFSKKIINKKLLNCETIKNNKYKDLEIKEIKNIDLNKLNNQIKGKFKNLNDYVKINNPDGDVYLILCSVDFDKNKQKEMNINSKMENYLEEIEKEFIISKSKEFRLFYNE